MMMRVLHSDGFTISADMKQDQQPFFVSRQDDKYLMAASKFHQQKEMFVLDDDDDYNVQGEGVLFLKPSFNEGHSRKYIYL